MLSCMVLTACCQKKNGDNTVVLTGKITGTEGKGRLIYNDSLQNIVYPEFNLQDGQLQVEFRLSEPQVVSLSFRDDKFRKKAGPGMYLPTKSAAVQFVAHPGQHIEISGDLNQDYMNIYPGGDKENDIFRQYTSAMFPIDNEMMNLVLAYRTDKTLPEATKQEYSEIIAEKAEEIFRILLNCVKACARLHLFRRAHAQKFQSFFNAFRHALADKQARAGKRQAVFVNDAAGVIERVEQPRQFH